MSFAHIKTSNLWNCKPFETAEYSLFPKPGSNDLPTQSFVKIFGFSDSQPHAKFQVVISCRLGVTGEKQVFRWKTSGGTKNRVAQEILIKRSKIYLICN